MLKRKKNKNEDAGAEVSQGISAEGNLIHRHWLIALLAIALPLLACFAYLLLLRDAGLQEQQIVRTARSHAAQQAANIESLLLQYRERLSAAATSPLALSAIASGKPQDLALVEKAMLDYFPGVTSLRLIALGKLGTATVENSEMGLRNNIEVDLLRRTNQGSPTQPESYEFSGQWLTSLAQAVQHPRQPDKRAVILATLDNRVFNTSLSAMGAELGRSELLQFYRSGNFTREDIIAAAGSGAAEDYRAETSLNGGKWQLRFTPSAQMLSLYRVDNMPLIIVAVSMLVIVIVAMSVLLLSIRRTLSAEVERITSGAERKSTMSLTIPQLLPLAREYRRATLRNTSALGGGKRSGRVAAVAREAKPVPDDIGIETEELAEEDVAPAIAAPESSSLPPDVFRAYDIRGLVESEITEEFSTLLGRALGSIAGEEEQQALVVGCDGRNSSPALKNALVKGLLDSGRDVVDIGLVPTPLMYFATTKPNTRSGVMVTASHNPSDYNGFKITLKGKPLSGEGLQMLRERMQEGKFSEGAGRLAKQDIKSSYLDAIISDIAITSPLRVVIDAGNGAAGDIAPRVLEGLGCEVIRLYCDIDGNFPNHHPDPAVDENLKDLSAKVLEEGADFGVAYDGDGDRLSVVTSSGDIVRNDLLLMLFAEDVVSRNPGADVVFDVKCSRHLTQLVSKHGGRPILWKTGHAFMREKVMQTGALLGGEFSGHIYFGERWYGFDDAIYATARLAEILSGTGLDMITLLEEYPVTENTPEIKIPVSDEEKFDIVTRLAEKGGFGSGKLTTIDGVRVDFNDGWGLLRASNTTPALTARFEAHDADALERIKQQFRDQLSEVAPELDAGF
ncbi:MAG: phosphomannomutase/phosphoglucomutase [Pseudomonadota bacterium]